jgi:preprotein translocase subunit Sec61beta
MGRQVVRIIIAVGPALLEAIHLMQTAEEEEEEEEEAITITPKWETMLSPALED